MGSHDALDAHISSKIRNPGLSGDEEMTLEILRLKSFDKWPANSPHFPTLLAKSGYYYTGNGDEVECFSCKGKISNWKSEDDPDTIHRTREPYCDFINGREGRNVPWKSTQDPAMIKTFLSHYAVNRPNEAADSCRSVASQNPLKKEEERRKTFVNWPHEAYLRPDIMARAGFHFIGPPDRVQCHFCSGILRDWERGDVPMDEHRKHFQSCRFILGQDVGNEPTGETIREKQRERATGTAPPKFSDMDTFERRLATFDKWPTKKTGQKPENLADAGFFYMNDGDRVKCFYCGCGLHNWEPTDRPLDEHTRLFPDCQFIKSKSQGSALLRPAQGDVSTPDGVRQAQAAAMIEQSQLFPSSSGVEYRVDPREVKARLDTPAVKTVLGLGYPREDVKQCLDHRLRTMGDDYPSAESLLEAIFSLQEARTRPSVVDRSDGVSEAVTPRVADLDQANSGRNDNARSAGNMTSKGDIIDDGDVGDPVSLMQENRSLKEQRTCKVCMDEEVEVVFLPCRHLVCCANCAPALNKCPVCRASIRGTVKVFAT